MFTIGLTGGIGSGKSTVCDLFSRHGITIVDADQIAHQLVTPGSIALQQIVEQFGPSVLLENGELDRRHLRDLIFSEPQEKSRLEHILHPLIQAEMHRLVLKSTSLYTIIAIPLLLEVGWQNQFDQILVIDCPEEQQIQRLMNRDKLTRVQANAALSNQCDRQSRLAIADKVILNNGTIDTLTHQVLKLHDCYTSLVNR